MPCTPPPGGVLAEHRYRPGTGVAQGRATAPGAPRTGAGRPHRRRGRRPTRLASNASSAVGRHDVPRQHSLARSPARTVRVAPRSPPSGRRPNRWARGSRPTARACRHGARLGSATVGWTHSTNGRAGCRPFATSRSPAAISSRVPPRCTVPASATCGSRHGTGRVERPVDLEHARPVAEPVEAAAVRGAAAGRPLPRAPDGGSGQARQPAPTAARRDQRPGSRCGSRRRAGAAARRGRRRAPATRRAPPASRPNARARRAACRTPR